MRVGIDLMSVSRFAGVAAHARYRTLVFSEAELAQADVAGPARRLERLASRFCAKEATCKLLGRGFGQGLRWRDIEVLNNRWGAPEVVLSGGARRLADEAGLREIVLTLSHQVDLVVAVAVAVEANAERPSRPRRSPSGVRTRRVRAVPLGGPLDAVSRLAAEVFGLSTEAVSTAESWARDLGVTSFQVIELLARLERHFGVRIADTDFYRMTDLRRTRHVVSRALLTRGAPRSA